MPQRAFEIESYSVAAAEPMGSTSGSFRKLSLASPALTHGIRTLAEIYFMEAVRRVSGAVTNVDQLNYDGQRVTAFCRLRDFGQWYDILRNERPLNCAYAYEGAEFDTNDPDRRLNWIQLTTSQPEPPGGRLAVIGRQS